MSRLERVKRLEKAVQPDSQRITILAPTDAEYEEYKAGTKPLPNGPYDWDCTNLSTEKLDEIFALESLWPDDVNGNRELSGKHLAFGNLSDKELEQLAKRYDI